MLKRINKLTHLMNIIHIYFCSNKMNLNVVLHFQNINICSKHNNEHPYIVNTRFNIQFTRQNVLKLIICNLHVF